LKAKKPEDGQAGQPGNCKAIHSTKLNSRLTQISKDSDMKRFIITLILLITAIFINHAFSRAEMELPRQPLSEFPTTIGDWKVINEQSIGESSMAVLKVDDYIMRSYANSKGDTIGLYIGYFKRQREGKQVHSPRQCLPNAGWYTVESKEIVLPPKTAKAKSVSINYYLMEYGA